MKIAHGRTDMAVAEQALDGVDIDPGFQQMGGKSVAQGVNATTALNASGAAGGMVNALGGRVVEWSIAAVIGKQPALGASDSPVQAQRFE